MGSTGGKVSERSAGRYVYRNDGPACDTTYVNVACSSLIIVRDIAEGDDEANSKLDGRNSNSTAL